MKLTGKCREDFEKWFMSSDVFNLNFLHLQNIQVFDRTKHFYKYPDSMQYGVYVDFFDSVGIYVMDKHNEVARRFYYDISTKPMSNDITSECNLTRPQARAAAIEKANEIYNSKR